MVAGPRLRRPVVFSGFTFSPCRPQMFPTTLTCCRPKKNGVSKRVESSSKRRRVSSQKMDVCECWSTFCLSSSFPWWLFLFGFFCSPVLIFTVTAELCWKTCDTPERFHSRARKRPQRAACVKRDAVMSDRTRQPEHYDRRREWNDTVAMAPVRGRDA